MTDSEIQMLKKLLVATAAYYGQQVPDNVLALYVEDLADLPFVDVARVLREIRRDPKTTRCPLPAAIRAKLRPVDTDEGIALAAVTRMIEAVSRYGWNNTEKAKEFCGELAWSIVTADGGWMKVCENLDPETLGVARAQWAKMALNNLHRSRAGTLRSAPALPGPVNETLVGLTPMTKLLQEMPL
jgi:hypothetical protein